ncbi:hypothetical protein ACIRU3_37915 [Streptomyces sp. NPDC101151]|uniref:hypothetical protein n=1 Tax=Streptomyces sp. NPDC101151 TaxID=3366115 RepID=UPI00381CB5E3
MGEQRTRAAGLGRDIGGGLIPPDLTDVDLRTLRAADDRQLVAAALRVLTSAHRLREVWYSGSDPDNVAAPPSGRSFSAACARPCTGEDPRG